MKSEIAIVWFKRDLRTTDHIPLVEGGKNQRLLCLYIKETNLRYYPTNQSLFIDEALKDLSVDLASLGQKLNILHGDILEILGQINQQYSISKILSHEETGDLQTFKRDKLVRKWCVHNGVDWKEYPSNGVVRGLKDRNAWSRVWRERMRVPIIDPPSFDGVTPINLDLKTNFGVKSGMSKNIALSTLRQKGGLKNGIESYDLFLKGKCLNYRKGMSSPIIAPEVCSRLSPYLAVGIMSTKEVYRRVCDQITELKHNKYCTDSKKMIEGLVTFKSRLHWRCHFIQKLEMEPSIEKKAIHPSFDGVYELKSNASHLDAWKNGNTGYPFIDACMRFLKSNGWINFRMRAMLTSFSSYDLHNHWTYTAEWLRLLFTDFEPGIHYPQIQMQSGLTGINTLRVYNPIKQGMDFDKDGSFTKKWVPELRNIDNDYIHQPWLLSNARCAKINFKLDRDYPRPIVDHETSSKKMAGLIYSIKKKQRTKELSKTVYLKHGSRKTLRSSRRKSVPKSVQKTLDFSGQ